MVHDKMGDIEVAKRLNADVAGDVRTLLCDKLVRLKGRLDELCVARMARRAQRDRLSLALLTLLNRVSCSKKVQTT